MSVLAGVVVALVWLAFMVGLLSLFVSLVLLLVRRVTSPEVAAQIRERMKWSGWTR